MIEMNKEKKQNLQIEINNEIRDPNEVKILETDEDYKIDMLKQEVKKVVNPVILEAEKPEPKFSKSFEEGFAKVRENEEIKILKKDFEDVEELIRSIAINVVNTYCEEKGLNFNIEPQKPQPSVKKGSQQENTTAFDFSADLESAPKELVKSLANVVYSKESQYENQVLLNKGNVEKLHKVREEKPAVEVKKTSSFNNIPLNGMKPPKPNSKKSKEDALLAKALKEGNAPKRNAIQMLDRGNSEAPLFGDRKTLAKIRGVIPESGMAVEMVAEILDALGINKELETVAALLRGVVAGDPEANAQAEQLKVMVKQENGGKAARDLLLSNAASLEDEQELKKPDATKKATPQMNR